MRPFLSFPLWAALLVAAAVLGMATDAPAENSAAAPSAAGDSQSAIAFLEDYDESVRSVVGGEGDSLSAADRRRLRARIDAAFDFRELARLGLAEAWEQRSEAQRDSFVAVYAELVKLDNLDMFIRYHRSGQIDYTSEEIDDDGHAMVRAQVPVKRETKEIAYVLYRDDDGGWRIYDLIIDGVGTIEGNHRVWSRIIARHSYDKLIDSLRRKLERLQDAG